MKKVLSMMALSAFIFAGCQEDLETLQEGAGEESVVRITLQAPDAMGMTRAGAGYTNSAKGGLTNVDWTQYDLRYQIAVYDADGKNQVVAPIVQIVKDASASSAAEFEVRLVNKREYRFVAWADFVYEGTTADLHYDTKNLTEITCKDDVDKQLNDESRDAYFVTEKQTVDASVGVALTLRRPFAKVRVVTTDWDKNGTYMPEEFKIVYYDCTRFTGLNAVTGVAEGETLEANETKAYTASFDKMTKDYSAGYEAKSDKNRTLTVDYLLASSSQTQIHFKLTASEKEGKEVNTYDFKTDIPIQRNYLTTILGNLLTENTKVKVTCEEDFEEEYNDYDNDGIFTAVKPQFEGNIVYIKTPGELIWLSQNFLDALAEGNSGSKNEHFDMTTSGPARGKGGYIFKLENDLDMEGVQWTPINWWPANDTGNDAGTFDGQGHTIRNLKIDRRSESQGLFGRTIINVKNLTIENASFNNVSNFAGAIAGNSYGTFENCHVKHIFIRSYDYTTATPPMVIRVGGMVGIHNGGNMKDCTAEDVNIKGYHSVGGLSGFVNENGNRTYENCHTTNSYLWNTASSGAGGKQIGAIVGVAGVALTLKDCSSANIEYKIGPYNEENGTPYIMVSGEEGTQGYGPQSWLYGNPNNITVVNSSSDSE